jgi:effector-binding domain-containing protein
MLEKPRIAHVPARLTAVIRLTIPRAEIQNVMGPGLGEIMAALANQGVAPAGPWFNHHLRMDLKIFDFEISVPVSSPITAVGRVKPGELPAAKVVRTVYHGGYEGLPSAWGEFDAWIAAESLATGPDLWEVYDTGPESGPDSATWSTELNRPLTR